jgi:hypothetical protein
VQFGAIVDAGTVAGNVRFTPESRHYSALHQMSALCHKRTSAVLQIALQYWHMAMLVEKLSLAFDEFQ